MSSDSIYIDSEYDPIPSSSNTSLSQEPWNKVQSTYAAKRKKMQAERMRQLKELEEQVTETANWNQRRKEIVSTSSRRPLVISEEFNHSSSPSSPTSTPPRSRQASTNSNNKIVDLGDATLEDLEGLIAASAKRLASYRLRNSHQRSDSITNQASPVPSSPSSSQTQRKNDEMERWKELLDHNSNSNSNSLSRLSTTKHYNADPLESPTTTTTTPDATTMLESGEKSPSASYLRLRNMFEKDNTKKSEHSSSNGTTLLSSKAPPLASSESSTKRSSIFSLAELAHHGSTASTSATTTNNSSTSTARKASTSSASSTNSNSNYGLDWKKNEISGITTTRSTFSNATPKIESPRISSSTTPRASSSHLRKATRSHSNHSLTGSLQPEISSSTILEGSSSSSSKSAKAETALSSSTTTTNRTRKLSTLASLQQRQRQNHHQAQKSNNEEDVNPDIKAVDDYMNSIKKPSSTLKSRGESNSFEEPPIVKRKVKLSITTLSPPVVVNNSSNSTTSHRKVTNLKPLNNSTITNTVVRRKRGKV